MKHILLAVLILLPLTLGACSSKYPDLKSPCAGADGNPCGPKRNANAG